MRHLVRAAALLFSLPACASLFAQQPDSPLAPAQAKQSQPRPNTGDDDALLAHAAKLYYSTKSAGLTGFDCAVHPDWLKLIQSSEAGGAVTENSQDMMLLKSIAISLHARMNGSSTLEWVQPSNASKPLDQASAERIDQMHKGIEETLVGFMQFWTPFVDGSVVPPNGRGIEIRHTASGLILHMKQPDAEVTEVFSNELILKEFKVVTGGKMIALKPSYDSSDDGLLVSRFVAHIGPENAHSAEVQEMHVEIYYQTVGDFPIPSRLNVEVVGTGTFDFKLDNCRVNPTA